MAGVLESRREESEEYGVGEVKEDYSSVLEQDGLGIDYEEIIDMEATNMMASHQNEESSGERVLQVMNINRSPEKRGSVSNASATPSLKSGIPVPLLEPLTSTPADDLFQVTNSIRRGSYNGGLGFLPLEMEHEESSILRGRHLNNDKLNKLVDQLEMHQEHSGAAVDLEIDDQLRTRFFKGRFNPTQFNVESVDEVDDQVGKYLGEGSFHRHNDNKENQGLYSDPLKSFKKSRIKKKGKPYTKNLRKGNAIPVLKPLSNLTNIELRNPENGTSRRDVISASLHKSPQRVCFPKKNIMPRRPSMKLENCGQNIFVVESSTGLLNDATQFGTELNSSNCEGFPLPEDTNEIVQIPTNEDSKTKVQKMAIIKALKNTATNRTLDPSRSPLQSPIGFYTKDELSKYVRGTGFINRDQNPSMQIVNQSVDSYSASGIALHNTATSSKPPPSSKKVKWAEDLEW